MGRGIIETAVDNKSLHLELEYRQPSMLGEGNASNEEPATDTGLALQYENPQASDSFAKTSRKCNASPLPRAAGQTAMPADGQAEQNSITNLTVNPYPRNRKNATMKKRSLTPVPGKQPGVSAEEIQQKVRQRAYELYELRGRTDGRDLDDWIEAESEVIRKHRSQVTAQ
jgi:hypothetical protein